MAHRVVRAVDDVLGGGPGRPAPGHGPARARDRDTPRARVPGGQRAPPVQGGEKVGGLAGESRTRCADELAGEAVHRADAEFYQGGGRAVARRCVARSCAIFVTHP